MRGKRVVLILAVLIVGVLVVQRALGVRLRISVTNLPPGMTFILKSGVDLGKIGRPFLLCRYFTGIGFKTDVVSPPDRLIGEDDLCPLLDRG